MSVIAITGGCPVRSRPFPSWPEFGAPEAAALQAALHGPYWGLFGGGQIERFQCRFAELQHSAFATAVCNGTVALRLALLAAGIRAGDEVIVPPYTFVATASAVLECNARPVFVDVNLETMNLAPAAVAAAITRRTRAIIPVHIGGLPCEMDELLALARRHGLVVIEDAAHAHGAEYKRRRAGSLGSLGCFSFQSSKNLTCGEGGAVTTSDPRLHERVQSLHNCGRLPGGVGYEHHVLGGNYRISEFQAAVLNAQLDRFPAQFALRERNAALLHARLREVPGLSLQAVPTYPIRHGNHLFLLRYDADVFGVPRAVFLDAMHADGIPASSCYVKPLYRQPLFTHADLGPYSGATRIPADSAAPPCPNCEALCAGALWLHQNVLLGSAADMADIAAAFEKLYAHRAELAHCTSAERSVRTP